MPPGFRRCSALCTADQEAAARLILARYDAVEPGTARFIVTGDGSGRLEWFIDLSRIAVGDGPAFEEMLRRAIQEHVK